MKFPQGTWVEVTVRRLDSPDVQLRGKVVQATRDFAVAECRGVEGLIRFTMSDDTAGYVFFRRLTSNDWQRTRR